MARKTPMPSKNAMRKLDGWDELTDEQLDEKYDTMVLGVQKDQAVQNRIDNLHAEFQDQYDLTELMPNDRAVLNNLVQAMVLLDMYNVQLFKLMKSPDDPDAAFKMDKYGSLCDKLTNNISRMQDDLKITRRARKTEKEQSVQSMITDMKVKARKFYDQKMVYILCPTCNTVLATVWVLYPDMKSTFVTECHRVVDNKVCGTRVSVDVGKLIGKGSNKPEMLPESMV